MSTVDYCFKCPHWGGDGLCDKGPYDDPSEPWCEMTLGGELLEENPLHCVEPDSPEYFVALWEDLRSVPYGEEIFEKIVKKQTFKHENVSKPYSRPITLSQIERRIKELETNIETLKSRDTLGELLLEIHKRPLSFNEILDLLESQYNRKLTGYEKCRAADKLRDLIKTGKLVFKNGKTYVK